MCDQRFIKNCLWLFLALYFPPFSVSAPRAQCRLTRAARKQINETKWFIDGPPELVNNGIFNASWFHEETKWEISATLHETSKKTTNVWVWSHSVPYAVVCGFTLRCPKYEILILIGVLLSFYSSSGYKQANQWNLWFVCLVEWQPTVPLTHFMWSSLFSSWKTRSRINYYSRLMMLFDWIADELQNEPGIRPSSICT